ncbi:MAG TPA: tRNA (adenosine(37)-N6)-threonylcarbamoyltransferase complex ATPase subunit type 1 TsaE [Salinimicrobium sp.]|nr:tRNA (adenosine(37)-N6)-threonylcarbamoyltransferase complex ATPase subunit type 1 TsaE [Salinimicrobium sp.]
MTRTYFLSEIDSVAQQLLECAKSKTLLFYGEMGAGKTTLIKALVKALGAEDTASSPTFSILNEYKTNQGPIYHFDFYRMEDQNEVLNMGFEEYFNTNAWKFVEWPQKIVGFLEKKYDIVEISAPKKGTRTLKFC